MNATQTPSTEEYLPRGLGWRQDLPDPRDLSPDSPRVQDRLKTLVRASSEPPSIVDLREYFPPVYNQAHLQSSSAHACIGLVEYFEGRAHGSFVQPSRLFLYKLMRRLAGVTGDAGAELRSGFKAVRQFGLPPERFWPHSLDRYDDEPDAFLYSFSDRYRDLVYVRADGRDTSGTEVLQRVRMFLAAGFPLAFGFPVPSSVTRDGDVPFYPENDSFLGGQAVIAVGYDDRRLRGTRGALLIRNSWGTEWGERGYGWLPYRFVEERLAINFWTLLKPDWLQSEEFYRPAISSADGVDVSRVPR